MGLGGRVCTKWVGLHVTAKKIKIQSNLLVIKVFFHRIIPKGQTNLSDYRVEFYLIWHPWDWRGDRVLNIQFVFKQYLY